jgi:hypothetical protein
MYRGKYLNQMMGSSNEKDFIQIKRDLAKRLGRPEIETISLNSYEANLVVCVIASSEIGQGFSDIGGMEDELDTVMENIVRDQSSLTLYSYRPFHQPSSLIVYYLTVSYP